MEDLLLFGFILLAYLVGSMPTAIWVSEIMYGIDIRQYGSGNSGATNTFRVLGKKAGFFVFFMDVFKGWTATLFASYFVYKGFIIPEKQLMFELIFGTTAVLGHIYSVFAGFKGGKGVATLFGMAVCINFEMALLSLAIFLLIFMAFHYVSLGSMLATLAFPIMMMTPPYGPQSSGAVIFAFVLFLLVVYTHQKNIKKLFKGEESKLYLYSRKK